jgi:hypothetical protein
MHDPEQAALSRVPAPQRRFLARALPVLRADERIEAIAGTGSWAGAGMDEYSDLDLAVLAELGAEQEVLRDAQRIAASLGDLLVGFPGDHVGLPNLLICLYGPDPLHVDLKFDPVEVMRQRTADPIVLFDRKGVLAACLRSSAPRPLLPELQWIEDRFWVWVHYAAAKLGRGELMEAIDTLAFLRSQVLSPLGSFLGGGPPCGNRRVEFHAPRRLEALARTVAPYERAGCLSALRAAVQLYGELRRELRARAPFAQRKRAEEAALQYLDGLEAGLRSGQE